MIINNSTSDIWHLIIAADALWTWVSLHTLVSFSITSLYFVDIPMDIASGYLQDSGMSRETTNSNCNPQLGPDPHAQSGFTVPVNQAWRMGNRACNNAAVNLAEWSNVACCLMGATVTIGNSDQYCPPGILFGPTQCRINQDTFNTWIIYSTACKGIERAQNDGRND